MRTGRGTRRGARGSIAVALVVGGVLAAGWLVPSAGRGSRNPLGPGAIVSYHYGNVGIDAPSRAGWTLTIDHHGAAFEAFDDTSVVVHRTVRLPASVWRRLARGARSVVSLRPSGDGVCAHPRSRMIRVVDDGRVLINRQFDVCGGNTVAAAHRIDAYVAPVVTLVPDFDALTRG